MTLDELEMINGRPFKCMLWNADVNPGWVTDWQGGALKSALKDCEFGVQMGNDLDPPTTSAFPQEVMSDDPELCAAHSVIYCS